MKLNVCHTMVKIVMIIRKKEGDWDDKYKANYRSDTGCWLSY